jgi:hypothetical protein
MAWKMSIDLSHPLVPHMGQHDPLDGLIAYTQIEATGAADPEGPGNLREEISIMREMCRGRAWLTDDPLGLGNLLSDAFSVAQLMAKGYFSSDGLLLTLLDIAHEGLEAFVAQGSLEEPVDYRLPFRELGLSIGLKGVSGLAALVEGNRIVFEGVKGIAAAIERLSKRSIALATGIERFWLNPEHQQAETWIEHRDINMVMLATSLSPDGYLKLS